MRASLLASLLVLSLLSVQLTAALAATAVQHGEYLAVLEGDPSLLGGMLERGCAVLRVFESFGIVLLRCPRTVEGLGLRGVVPNLEVTRADVDLEVVGGVDALGGYEGGYTLYWSWAVSRVGADMVWGYLGTTGEGVVAAVLDTGIDPEHPLLAEKLVTVDPNDPYYPGGWIEFDGYGRPVCVRPRDLDGHGTWVSSILAGGDTSRYIFGVAPSAKLMVAAVLPGGRGTFAQVLAGLEWALEPYDCRGRKLPNAPRPTVISMSLGALNYYGDVFLPAIRRLLEAGIVVVAAAGNGGPYTSANPGNIWGVIGVGATDFNDDVAYFSSYEEVLWPEPPADWPFKGRYPESYRKPDIAAPGVRVAGAYPGGYLAVGDGTSAATPLVAGVAALLAGYLRQRGYSGVRLVEEVYDILTSTAAPVDHPGAGHGRVRAYLAVSRAAEAPVEHVYVSTSPEYAWPRGTVRVMAGVTPGRPVDVYVSGIRVYSGSYPTGGVTVTVPETHVEGNTVTVVTADGRVYGETLLYVVPAMFVEANMTSGRLYDLVIAGLEPVARVTIYGTTGGVYLVTTANLRGFLRIKVLAPHVSEPAYLTLVASSAWAYLTQSIYVSPPGVYAVVGRLEESLGVERERIDGLSRAVEELRPELLNLVEEFGRLRESLAAEIGELGSALGKLKAEVGALSADVSDALSSIADLRRYAADLGTRLSTVEEGASRLRAELDEAGSRLRSVEGDLADLRASYGRVSAGLEKLSTSVREELDRVSRDLDQLSAALGTLQALSAAALALALVSLALLAVLSRALRKR